MNILPILTDNGMYPGMEIGLSKPEVVITTAEWLICEIPMLKPMFDYANVLVNLENILVSFGITFLAVIQHKL